MSCCILFYYVVYIKHCALLRRRVFQSFGLCSVWVFFSCRNHHKPQRRRITLISSEFSTYVFNTLVVKVFQTLYSYGKLRILMINEHFLFDFIHSQRYRIKHAKLNQNTLVNHITMFVTIVPNICLLFVSTVYYRVSCGIDQEISFYTKTSDDVYPLNWIGWAEVICHIIIDTLTKFGDKYYFLFDLIYLN